MATDPWYVRELVADIPADEWAAAVETEDWEGEELVGEEGDETEDEEQQDEEDGDYSEEESDNEDGSDSEDEGSGEFMECELLSEGARTPEGTPPSSSCTTPDAKSK